MRAILLSFLFLSASFSHAQKGYWQQRVEYRMDIDFDDSAHQFTGKQQLIYHNNSGDTLRKVYYHLYFNAFRPGSMMDVRSRTIADPDPRVGDRIAALTDTEIGYQQVNSLTQDGIPLQYEVAGTVLEVALAHPILPGSKTVFDMDFEAQVPVQIRRSGRNSEEGIAYSMTQWYPKMAEYDREGWHATPYVSREFYGVWGDYEVNIIIQKDYVLGGTGVVQNADEVGHGYSEKRKKNAKEDRIRWRFKAENVHDFAWAADKHYTHDRVQVPDGPELHFLYLKDSVGEMWTQLKPLTVKAFGIMSERFGKYPYPQFSVIQGGDGGMEYPMATLVTSGRKLSGLVSVTVHEALHNWYYGVLATNESKYPWMDEGFTSYAQNIVLDGVHGLNSPGLHDRSYAGYYSLVGSAFNEPSTTHADFYHTNRCYGLTAYSKGAVFVHQLGYVIGEDKLREGLLRYFHEWGFKHPRPEDFLLVMEKVSGLELDWYLEQFIGSMNTIDYGIRELTPADGGTEVLLERTGRMPMPIDLVVTLTDGRAIGFNIPLQMMRGAKNESFAEQVALLPDWPWVYPVYGFKLPFEMKDIRTIEIDPSGRLADVNPANNRFPPVVTETETEDDQK
ncbi:MAG: M1 family metallopeptidase [Flavobacteriales bacterium]|nr:M1 family metallopeptidase [Flavobacteriales bacterium]